MKRILVLLTALAVAACNGKSGSVAGPSGADSSALVTVTSGRTEQPIPSLAGLTAVPGQGLFLQSAGFFSFRTSFSGKPIMLWPADDGFLTAHHTRKLVYGNKDPGKLFRLPPSVTAVSLVPDANIRAFPWALDRIRKAAEALSSSHPALDFAVDGPGFPVSLEINFADQGFVAQPGAAGLAYVFDDDSGTITQARVVFRSLQIQSFWYTEENFQCAVTHETLHTTGLDHSDGQDPLGIMSEGPDSYRFLKPSPQEQLIMKMQYARLPGTVLSGMTESDPGLAAKSTGKGRWHLVCAR